MRVREEKVELFLPHGCRLNEEEARRPKDREKGRRLAPTSVSAAEAEQMDDAPIPLDLERKKAEKRSASDVEELILVTHPVDLVDVQDVWMSRLEAEEKKTIHIATEDYYMPMTVCEEAVGGRTSKSCTSQETCRRQASIM